MDAPAFKPHASPLQVLPSRVLARRLIGRGTHLPRLSAGPLLQDSFCNSAGAVRAGHEYPCALGGAAGRTGRPAAGDPGTTLPVFSVKANVINISCKVDPCASTILLHSLFSVADT